MATAKGHLDQEAKYLRSTSSHQDNNNDEYIAPKQEDENICTHDIICAVIDSKTLNSKSYSNQTGCFPVKSSSGNQYIFIPYHYNKNTIHVVPFKKISLANITKVWIDTFQFLRSHGKAPTIHILDNECSHDLK